MASSNNNNNNKNGQHQLVPESVLKRKHDMDELKQKRAAQAPRGNRKVFSKTKAQKVNKAETFIANGRARRNHDVRYKRVLKKGMQKRASDKKEYSNHDSDKIQINSVGSKVVFCVRIRDPVGCPKSVKAVLTRLRLNKEYQGVFVRYNASTRKMLHLVEPWVLYGIPSRAMVEDLIHRRGHGKIKGERVALSNNNIIEEALGDDGILCVEDLVHEIVEVGDAFSKVNTFLWPFELAAPKSRFQKEKLNEKDEGEYGDKGEGMNDYIKQML